MAFALKGGREGLLMIKFDPKSSNALLASFLAGGPPGQSLLGFNGGPLQPRSPLVQTTVKRSVYFAFEFDDVMRVNNVRNAWKIDHPDSDSMRSFRDRSIWEASQREGDETLKRLMREAVQNTSAVCVLVGSQTWSSCWVRYEIARSVIDNRGLLAVHINGLNHHQRRRPDLLGFNPLSMLGVCKSHDGKFYLYEQQHVVINVLTGEKEWQWRRYNDHTHPVTLRPYLLDPGVGYVRSLSEGAGLYDFVAGEGHKNIGAWIDRAAKDVGR